MTTPIFIKMQKDGQEGKHDEIAESRRHWCFRFKRYVFIRRFKALMHQCKETKQERNKLKPVLLEIEYMSPDMMSDDYDAEYTETYRVKLACSIKCPLLGKVCSECGTVLKC